jgi:hypothetical protein
VVSKTYIEIERNFETLEELRAYLDQISFEFVDGGADLWQFEVAGNTMAKDSSIAFRARLCVDDPDA